MINRRRVCGGKSLPYDYEVEYLEATGPQWIDTGFKATGGCIFDFEAMWTTYGEAIVGSHNPSSNFSNGFNRNQAYIYAQNKVQFNKCNNFEGISYPCSVGIKYHVYYNSIGSNRIGSIDGNVIVNQTNTGTLNPVNNVVFFLVQYNLTYQKGRIYNCKLYDSTSTLVRDFIPVRVGQVGYLYDKVSGELFGNNGTGEFILGPDV